MKAVIKEWVEKAEGDFVTAVRESRARKNPNYDAVCFHAQQCVEKYLKGVLQADGVAFTKTHDLVVLLQACASKRPLWLTWETDAKLLSRFAVQYRYPGESATKGDATAAAAVMKWMRAEIRPVLGLRNGC
jgi:HEPN domain-containing protein